MQKTNSKPAILAFNPLASPQAAQGMLLFFTGAAFLLRTVNLAGQSLWRDEVDAIRFSSWTFQDLLSGLFRAGHNGPLFFICLRFWRSLAGNSEFALRYPSVVFGALAIPLGFGLARQLGFGRRAGLLLGLLLATSPYLVWYGQEAKMYTLLLALVTLAFIAYLKALDGAGKKWWGVFVVATSLSFYTHILSPLMLGVYAVTALLYHRRWRQHWRGWLISLACLTLPYIPLAWWQWPLLLDGYQSGHPFYSLREQTYLLLQLYSRGLLHFAELAPIILVVFLFLGGLFLNDPPREGSNRSRRPAGRGRAVLAAWALLPPLIVYLISRRVPVFEDRYLIYITPAFYLLLGVGLVGVRAYGRRLAALCLGLALVFNLMGIWQQQRQPIKADFRAAAAYLARRSPSPAAIMVQTPYLQHTLNYYYPYPYKLLEGLWTNDNKSEATVATEMRALTAGLADLWLLVSEEELWDQRHLTRAWLDEHAQLTDQAHFMRVDVYYYRFTPASAGDLMQPVESIPPTRPTGDGVP
ncbi:MAG: glycosyltransferase family 39 protein [Chloroflexota bacterium]